jgi:hypothetical protein
MAPTKPLPEENDVALIRYDAACRAVATAKSVDEAKDIRDKSEAMRVYAKQAKNRELEIDAAEIRMRAERRLGELIRAQKETVGLAKGGQPYRKHSTGSISEPVGTLAEAGIDKKLSSLAQKLAAVPEKQFEAHIAGWRDGVSRANERITANLLLRNGTKRQKVQAESFDSRNLISEVIQVLVRVVEKWPPNISLGPLIFEVRSKLEHIEKRRKVS